MWVGEELPWVEEEDPPPAMDLDKQIVGQVVVDEREDPLVPAEHLAGDHLFADQALQPIEP